GIDLERVWLGRASDNGQLEPRVSSIVTHSFPPSSLRLNNKLMWDCMERRHARPVTGQRGKWLTGGPMPEDELAEKIAEYRETAGHRQSPGFSAGWPPAASRSAAAFPSPACARPAGTRSAAPRGRGAGPASC